jgi:membrane-bound ClpP family serine protease
MSLIVVLFAAGVLLIGIEVVVPGGILGIIGSLFMLAGVVVSFDRFGFGGGAAATAAGLLIACVALYFEFVFLPKSRIARALSMTATVHGRSQPAVADRALIGRCGVAVTTLAPSGVIECDGRRYEAFARSGLVAAGSAVEVIDLDTFRVIVTQSTNQPTRT